MSEQGRLTVLLEAIRKDLLEPTAKRRQARLQSVTARRMQTEAKSGSRGQGYGGQGAAIGLRRGENPHGMLKKRVKLSPCD